MSKNLKEQLKYTSRIAIIIKDKYFKTISHQVKLTNPTNNSNEIFEISKKLFKEYWDETPIRLIGIRLDLLSNTKDYQISLFENIENKEKDEKIEKVLDELLKKYGDKIIKK